MNLSIPIWREQNLLQFGIKDVEQLMKIAIIGSGIAAATLTAHLREARPDVMLQLFEKSRGIGGRMSTRRREPWAFDHGVPFFTARTESFQQILKAFQTRGVIDEWQPKVITLSKDKKPYNRDWFEPHYVSCPTMNQLCKALLDEQPVAFQQTINRITGQPGEWQLDSAVLISKSTGSRINKGLVASLASVFSHSNLPQNTSFSIKWEASTTMIGRNIAAVFSKYRFLPDYQFAMHTPREVMTTTTNTSQLTTTKTEEKVRWDIIFRWPNC